MKNKNLLIIGIGIIVLLVLTGIITSYIDGGRVSTNHEPKYCIKTISKDGSKITYWGLGYKVIRYVELYPNEPYQNSIGVKMGSWFMKYELPIDSQYNKNEEIETDINNLDDFYNLELTKNNDIRNLGKEYSLFDAQKDNCFVIGAMVHNDNLYTEFMNNYKDKKTVFLRVAQNTVEGDLILTDILYYEKTDKLYLVTDNTRDEFFAKQDRKIELTQFENISEYNYENHLYWILHNGEINEETFNSENVFVITTID